MLPFVLGDVFINEILPNGAIEPDSEWVELFNNGSSAVNLNGWNITEKGASSNLTLNLSIPANGFVVLVNNFTLFNLSYPNLNSTGLVVDYGEIVPSFQLANSNGFLDLYNSSGEKVSNISYSSATSGNSIGRHPDGSSNIINLIAPTPGAKNDNVAPASNKWVNPSANNSQASVSLNITINITDAASAVNTSLVDFNGTNFSMTKSGDLWFFLWNISKNIDKVHNITAYFNDSNGFASSDTIFNTTSGHPPIFNKWVNPSQNNSFVGSLLNITANITDITSVNSALVNFNNSNFSMSQNNNLWYFLWDASLNSDKNYNITIFFNDSFGFSNTDTLLDITVDNTKPKILTPNTTANSRNFVNPGSVFNASVNATDTNLLNVTCSLSGTTVGNFSVNGGIHKCNLTAPSSEGEFEITLTATDRSGNSNTTTVNFTTKHTTAATLTPTDITVSGLNQSNKIVQVNATLSNTGTSAIYDAGAILSGFSSNVLSATSVSYNSCSSKLNTSQSCNVTFNVTVKGASASGTQTIFWNSNWTNNNFTINQFTQAVTSTVTISSNPQFSVIANTSPTIAHGQNTTLALDINSTGNSNLEDVNITFISSTLPSAYVTIQPTNFNSIAAGTNKTFNVTVVIPEHTNPGNYTGTLNITASSIQHKAILLRAEVPTDSSWASFPQTIKSFKTSGFAGLLGNATINNTGNIGQNYSIVYDGNLFFFIWNRTLVDNSAFTGNAHVYVERNQAKGFSMFHKADGPLTSYNLTITITSTNTSSINVSTANLTRDDSSPFVNITNPINNSFVKNTVEFNVTSTDLNLSRVDFYINDQLVLNDSSINFTFNWNTTNGTYPDSVYKLETIATDTSGNFNSSNINVTVNNTDDDPVFTGTIPTIYVIEDNDSTILNLSIYFKTLDGDSLSYNFTQPNNVTVQVNNATQIANFSPSANFSGINNITFTAIDSSQNTTSSNNVIINVSNVNDAPTVPATTGPTNGTTLRSASGQVNLVWNASLDVDGDIVTYFVFFSNNSLNVSLNTTPVNATTASTTAQLNGLANGTYFWNLIAGDGELNSSRTPTLQFTLNSDNKPNITFWKWNNTLQVSASNTTNNKTPRIAENSNISFEAIASDPNNDAITYQWYLNSTQKSAAKNFSFNFSNNFSSKGFYNITLIVLDNNSNEDRENWNLTITNANRAPTITQIPNQKILEDSSNLTINLSAFFTEPDTEDSLAFIVIAQNSSKVSCIIKSNNVTLIGASNFAGNGSNAASCTIIASDSLLNSTNNTFSINVSNVQDAPILNAIGSLTATEEILFFYDVNATDPDGDIISFSDNTTLFNISPSTGIFTLNATNSQVGSYIINISVNDTNGLTDFEVITLTVTNSNDKPTLDSIANKTAVEDSTLRFNVTASDIDGDSLTFSSNISGMTFTNAANNSLSTVAFTPTNSNVGNNTVNITVSDSSLADSQTFLITVTNTNDAPTISLFFPTANKTIAENVGSQLFNVTVVDVDLRDSLTIKWYRNGTVINLNSTNVTITGLDQGIYNVTAIASDASGASVRNAWTLTVSSQVTSTDYTSPITSLNSSQLESATNVKINHSISGGIDFGNNSLNFSGVTVLDNVVNISKGVIAVDTANFPGLNKSAYLVMKGLNFTKAPLIFYNSGFNIISGGKVCNSTSTPRCTNIAYNTATGILGFNVEHFSTYYAGINSTNGPPVITSTPVTSAAEGTAYSYDVDASDNEGDALTFSLNASPAGMSISSASGVISWIPSSGQLGANNVTVFVSDGSLTDNQSFTINASKGAKMIISDLDAEVNGKKDNNVNNNTKIKKEAKPGSEIEFKIEIENRFTKEEDLEIEDIQVEVIIENIDDGDDIEEEADEFDLDQGKDKKVTIKLEVPLLVDEGDYDVIIDVEGEDKNGTGHDIRWQLELEVEKEKHDLRLRKINLNPTAVSCSRTAVLSAQVLNLGSEDEDEVRLEILNGALGISSIEQNIKLDEGDEKEDVTYEKILRISVPENQEPGIYPIKVNAYVDNDDLEDSETIDLTVQDCERLREVKESVKDVSKPVEVVRPTVVAEKVTPVSEITFRDSNAYLVFLIANLILLLGAAVVIVGAAWVMLRKR